MDSTELRKLLLSLQGGGIDIDTALERLRHLPFEDLGDATVDHHRELRTGFPEVIFGQGKSVGQIERIMVALLDKGNNVLVTRLDAEKALPLRHAFPAACYHDEARCHVIEQKPPEIRGRGTILVISAGTSDLPVAAARASDRPRRAACPGSRAACRRWGRRAWS